MIAVPLAFIIQRYQEKVASFEVSQGLPAIFTPCDRVAQGVVDAYQSIGSVRVPVIVRLQGTNATEAKVLIDNSGLKVFSAISLQDAADLVRKHV